MKYEGPHDWLQRNDAGLWPEPEDVFPAMLAIEVVGAQLMIHPQPKEKPCNV